MRSKLRSTFATVAAAALVLGSTGVAVADDLYADGDGLTPVADQNMSLGTICLDGSASETALMAIRRQGHEGNSNSRETIFRDGATVTFSVQSVSGPGFGATTDPAAATVSLPAGWTALANNTMSEAVSSIVTFNPTSVGTFRGEVTYAASGTNANGGPLKLTDLMTVSVTVSNTGACAPASTDTSTPVITPIVTGTLGDSDWYTSDVTVAWDVEDAESPVTSTPCETQTVTQDTNGVTFTCSATSAGGTSSESVTIKRDATPPTFECDQPSEEWSAVDVTLQCTASDAASGLVGADSFGLSTDVESGTETDDAQTGTHTLEDEAGNSVTAGPIAGNKVDKKAPVVSCGIADGGWHGDNVEIGCTAEDNGSGLANAADARFTLSTTVPDGVEDDDASTDSRVVDDLVGNSSQAGPVVGNKVDRKGPEVSWTAGPEHGTVYQFGDMIPTPQCDAADHGSGVEGTCSVSGFLTSVGTHTVTATAIDYVGNERSIERTYTVEAWKLDGFYRPVDMGKLNTIKAGSTVPLKFNAFKGDEPLSSGIGATFSAKRVTCGGGVLEDAIEEFATTGKTELRYDADGQQWIQNWATPKAGAGSCYVVTMQTADGSTISADFKLK